MPAMRGSTSRKKMLVEWSNSEQTPGAKGKKQAGKEKPEP
jgi:hypothetical protein